MPDKLTERGQQLVDSAALLTAGVPPVKGKKKQRRYCARCAERIRRRDAVAYTPDHDPPYWHRPCLAMEQAERGAELTALHTAITILQGELSVRERAFHRLTQEPTPGDE